MTSPPDPRSLVGRGGEEPSPSVSARGLKFAIAMLAGCGSSSSPAPPPPPPDSPGIVAAVDENPDPHVFELHLEAKGTVVSYVEGLSTSSWTYDDTVPG